MVAQCPPPAPELGRSAAEGLRVGNRRARAFMLQQAEDAEWERVRTEPRPVDADAHARGIGQQRLQLVVAPSFEPAAVWEVRQGREWQLIRPRVVGTDPELLVVGHEVVPFASTLLAAYFERVSAIHLPLRPDAGGCVGADGTTYEFAVFGDGFSGWRFRWWSSWPEQWRPLVELAAEMHAAFTAVAGPNAEPGAAADDGA